MILEKFQCLGYSEHFLDEFWSYSGIFGTLRPLGAQYAILNGQKRDLNKIVSKVPKCPKYVLIAI